MHRQVDAQDAQEVDQVGQARPRRFVGDRGDPQRSRRHLPDRPGPGQGRGTWRRCSGCSRACRPSRASEPRPMLWGGSLRESGKNSSPRAGKNHSGSGSGGELDGLGGVVHDHRDRLERTGLQHPECLDPRRRCVVERDGFRTRCSGRSLPGFPLGGSTGLRAGEGHRVDHVARLEPRLRGRRAGLDRHDVGGHRVAQSEARNSSGSLV